MWLRRGDHEQAALLLRESIRIAQETGDQATIASCLERFAQLTTAEERFGQSARLFGAAETLRKTSGSPRSHADLASLELALDAARLRLDETAWTRAWNEGRAMSPEQAIAYDLSSPEPALAAVSRPAAVGRKATPLTRREREIAGLIARGLTNGQIARQLVLSERTVDTHGVNIMRKLGVRSRAQVAAWAIQEGPFSER